MKNNFLKFIKAKHNLTNEIKNMSMDEKIKSVDEAYDILKEIPNDLDLDLLVQIIKVAESVYYEAKASGVDKKYLKKIEELVDERKEGLKNTKKQRKENEDELSKLFEDLDELDELPYDSNKYAESKLSQSTEDLNEENEKNSKIINLDKFTYQAGDIEIVDTICDACIYNNTDNKNICVKYPNGKPKDVLENKIDMCPKFKMDTYDLS